MPRPIQFSGRITLANTRQRVKDALIRDLAKQGIIAEEVGKTMWIREGRGGHIMSGEDLVDYKAQHEIYLASKGTDAEAAERDKLRGMADRSSGLNYPFPSLKVLKGSWYYQFIIKALREPKYDKH